MGIVNDLTKREKLHPKVTDKKALISKKRPQGERTNSENVFQFKIKNMKASLRVVGIS